MNQLLLLVCGVCSVLFFLAGYMPRLEGRIHMETVFFPEQKTKYKLLMAASFIMALVVLIGVAELVGFIGSDISRMVIAIKMTLAFSSFGVFIYSLLIGTRAKGVIYTSDHLFDTSALSLDKYEGMDTVEPDELSKSLMYFKHSKDNVFYKPYTGRSYQSKYVDFTWAREEAELKLIHKYGFSLIGFADDPSYAKVKEIIKEGNMENILND